MKVVALLAACMAISVSSSPLVFNSALQQAFLTRPSIDIMISMRAKTTAVLAAVESNNYVSTDAKATTLYNELNRFSSASQAPILDILSRFKSDQVKIKGFYINNKISVRGATLELVSALLHREDIEEIREAKVIHLDAPALSGEEVAQPKVLEWGVSQINAPECWDMGVTGAGVVVSNIDTGIRHTHVSLRDGYRAEYGWYDPYQMTPTPNDQNGHGSHTMGSIAGRNGTGVAPGAQWIACKGCATSECTEEALIGCGEWTFCPTLADGTAPNCTLRAHVSSNSWGGGNEDPFYDEVIAMFNSVDIIPVFAIGNSGPGCRTANSPGDRPGVISVGATNNEDAVAYFSSHGPTLQTSVIKPEVSAPGVNVRSCGISSDTTFALLSGTSMACPHVAGAVALLIEAGLTNRTQIAMALQDTTVRPRIDSIVCTGGGVDPDNPWPNNSFGWGRIDAWAAVLSAKKFI